MIDELLARRAAATFARLTSGKWGVPHTEIQDDGTFVLLTVDVPSSKDSEVESKLRPLVANALNELIQPHSEQKLGSWMVVFRRDGYVYESLLPSGL